MLKPPWSLIHPIGTPDENLGQEEVEEEQRLGCGSKSRGSGGLIMYHFLIWRFRIQRCAADDVGKAESRPRSKVPLRLG